MKLKTRVSLFTNHWLVSVFLELDQPDSGHILQVHVPVGAVWGVSVQVRGSGWRGDPQSLIAVNLVRHHIMGLQQSLGGQRSSKRLRSQSNNQIFQVIVVCLTTSMRNQRS